MRKEAVRRALHITKSVDHILELVPGQHCNAIRALPSPYQEPIQSLVGGLVSPPKSVTKC